MTFLVQFFWLSLLKVKWTLSMQGLEVYRLFYLTFCPFLISWLECLKWPFSQHASAISTIVFCENLHLFDTRPKFPTKQLHKRGGRYYVRVKIGLYHHELCDKVTHEIKTCRRGHWEGPIYTLPPLYRFYMNLYMSGIFMKNMHELGRVHTIGTYSTAPDTLF